ncbi:MAG: TonB-dependent receptor [Muribaculaceae bacterium]|nr:TonB-dependent receptor [Muribaculaceae bacterium]
MKPLILVLSLLCSMPAFAGHTLDEYVDSIDWDTVGLYEITVTAQRRLVSKEIDRVSYDVQADDESKTSPLLDILKKVPLVTVQPDGTILVNGSSDYKIYRNGRPNASFSNNAKELFRSIPASSIKRIEVITDPGAREDAEGVSAILNIVTNENTSLRGVAGTVSTSANTLNYYPNYLNGFLTTQVDKFTIAPYAGVYHSSGPSTRGRSEGHYTFADTGQKMDNTSASDGQYSSCYWGFDSSLEIDTLNLLTIEYSGNTSDQDFSSSSFTSLANPDGSPVYSYKTEWSQPNAKYNYQQAGVNYQRSTRLKDESITLSYMFCYSNSHDDSETEYYDVFGTTFPYSGTNTLSNSRGQEHTAQLDWARPFGKKHKMDFGAKYIYRRSRGLTTQDYIGWQTDETDFISQTHVASLYADWRATFGKVGLRAGVRYEFSRLGGESKVGKTPKYASNFNDIVPNAAVNWNINDSHSFKFSYGMRINRPGIWYLDPSVSQTPTSVSQGNPYLHSAKNHNINANYSLMKQKLNLDISAYIDFSNNGISNVLYAKDNVMYSTYENVGKNFNYGFSAYAQWTISDKSSVMFNGSVRHSSARNPGHEPGTTVKNSGWYPYIYAQLTQKLPWKLRANVGLSYWGGGGSGPYSKYECVGWSCFDHSLSLQRSWLKDDRLTVQLSTQNPFGPRRSVFRTESFNSGRDGYNINRSYANSYASVRVSFRFGSLQASVKKTKSISNDDVQSSSSSPSK